MQQRRTDAARDARTEGISRPGFFARLLRKKVAFVGLSMLIVVSLAAICAPWLAPNDPLEQTRPRALESSSRDYLLGTDHLGRCVLSRGIYGARISLMVGMFVVLFRILIGVPAGLVAGFYGGKFDSLIMRVTDVFISFPGILLAIAFMAVWGPGIWNVVMALSVVGWPQYARLVRGEVLSVKEEEFVEAGRALGLSDSQLIFRHLLPNVATVIIVYGTLGLAAPIVSEAALSFLGLGTQPPAVSWGRMLSEGRRYLHVAPGIATFPGLTITITVMAFNLFGDGLRDVLDPRQRH